MKPILSLTLMLVMLAATPAVAQPETPDVAVTQWTDSMELFMEYPVLLTNMPGRFIIHLTILDGFQPIREGSVTLRFTGTNGSSQEVTANELLREGIFTPTVELAQPGRYDFELSYTGPGAASSFIIEDFAVYSSVGEIAVGDDGGATDEIGFLKEQQWKIPFATIAVASREIKESVWAIGEVMPAPTAYVEIIAPVNGVLQVAHSGELALPGSRVKRGDVVARIAPPLQGDGWATSQITMAQAERNYERARRLREKDAISDREFEEAQNEYNARRAGHERVVGSGQDGVLTLTAPMDGQIIDWEVRPGQRLAAGDELMAIADPSVVWLKVNVYETDFRELGVPVGAFIKSGGEGGGWAIPEADMRVLTTGGALDPVTRTVPILLEVTNSAGRLTINESTPVELYASDGASAIAVPRSAIYQDEGVNVVFVQAGGESFEKRSVVLGPHHAGWVSVLSGIEPGERVVTRGGYHVKLASTSAAIGHGHAH